MLKKLFTLFATLTLSAGLWAEDIPNNQIWYTTTDGQVIQPRVFELFNVSVLSNTYENGKGVITFDGDLVRIGQSVFYAISTLESVSFPASLRTIGNNAFGSCSNLTTVNLNEGLDTIGHAAFNDCAMTEISIPASVRVLETLCFYQCRNLKNIFVHWTESSQIPQDKSTASDMTPYAYKNSFDEIAWENDYEFGRKYATLFVLVGMENLYYKSSFWSNFGTIKEDIADIRTATIAEIEAAKQGVTNTHILAIADDAIAAINAATNGSRLDGIKTQALADITNAKAILDDLPTDAADAKGTTVTITKGDKTLKLVNPDKVEYGKQE